MQLYRIGGEMEQLRWRKHTEFATVQFVWKASIVFPALVGMVMVMLP